MRQSFTDALVTRSELDVFSSLCLFVSVFVCFLFVCMITYERLNIGQSKLAARYTVQKSLPNSKITVNGQRSRSPGTENEKLLSQPTDNA